MRHVFVFAFATLFATSVYAQKAKPAAAGGNRDLIFTIDPVAPANFKPVWKDGKFHADILGVWEARGYGFVFEVGETELRWFSHTKEYCWEHTPDEPLGMMFAIEAASGRCYLKPYPTEGAVIIERMDSLPSRFDKQPSVGPRQVFDAVDQTMAEYYAFFKHRKHDWGRRVRAESPMVTEKTTDADLFAAFERMFEGLNDGHTSLTAEVDGERKQTSGGRSAVRQALEDSYLKQKGSNTRQEYFGGWSKKFYGGIKEDLLGGNGKSEFGKTLIWGRVTSTIGYLYIRDMASYSEGEDDTLGGLRRLHGQLEQIFSELADCDAMIIDVSVNQGGFHSYAMAFASHIADKRRYTLSKYPLGRPDLLQKFDVLPFTDATGQQKTFTKPVYVITTDATVSAGEEFVLAARAFPHVKVVGGRTRGMLSDMLEKPLPNGWMLTLSNEIFLDHQGKCFEVTGIPRTSRDRYSKLDDIDQVGHAESIRKLAEEIAKSLAKP